MRPQLRYAEARVKKGAAHLDKRIPDWFEQVKIRPLDMKSGCRCVLGQLFGDYSPGAIGVASMSLDEMSEDERLGFDVPATIKYDESEPYYRKLTELWRDEIRQRRGRK